MPIWLHALSLFSVLAYAVLGRVFLAFSDFIMRSLGSVESGAEAMRAINQEVFRTVFMALFLGMVPVSLALIVGAWANEAPLAIVIAGLTYLVGCFVVTAAGNVPLNNALAAFDAGLVTGTRYWTETYLPRWTALNTMRTLACLVASAALLHAVTSH